MSDPYLNQADFCEVCSGKDDEDLYIVFNALFRVFVGDVFYSDSEKPFNEFDLNPLSLYPNDREEDFKTSQEKLQLFKNKVSSQMLLDLIASPRFDLLLREIFKSKYSRMQDSNCKTSRTSNEFYQNV